MDVILKNEYTKTHNNKINTSKNKSPKISASCPVAFIKGKRKEKKVT